MAVIFVAALGVRLAIAWASYGPQHVFDGEAERIGRSIALHGQFGNPYLIPTGATAHCGPFYPTLMSIIYLLLGTGSAATLARTGLLILINSIDCALLPPVATALRLPLWCGAGAGLWAAIIPMHRTAETFNAWDEPYAAMGLMGALILLVGWRALRQRRTLALVTYGALWGVLLHLSAIFLVSLLGLAISEVLSRPNRRRFEIRAWLVVCLAAGLILVPWTVRNRMRLGGWIFARSTLGLELAVSNGDGIGPLGNDAIHPSYNIVEAERVRRMGEIAYNHERLATTIRWIQTHPKRFGILTLERFGSFWFGWWGNPGTAWALTLTTLLAVVGAWFMWRDRQRHVLGMFGVVWLCFPCIYYIVEYVPRYRIPIWWTVLLAAAYGAGRLVMSIRGIPYDQRGANDCNVKGSS